MKLKKAEKILAQLRDEKAVEVFGLHEYDLNPLQVAEQAEQVCKMLDDRYLGISTMTNQQIADQLGISKKFVEHISSGNRWVSVSKNHPFYQAKMLKEDNNGIQ